MPFVKDFTPGFFFYKDTKSFKPIKIGDIELKHSAVITSID